MVVTKALFTLFMNLISKKAKPMQLPQHPPSYPDLKTQGANYKYINIYKLHACQKQHKQLQAAAILL